MKNPALTLFVIQFCLVSLLALFLMVSDKHRARAGKWRIPEAVLLTVGAFGGAAVMCLTMQLIRHKTKHRRFVWGLPIMTVFHLLIAAWLFRFGGGF